MTKKPGHKRLGLRRSGPAAPIKETAGCTVTLREGREKSLLKRHPWVFSGAVASIGSDARDGSVADVVSASGAWLGRGYLNRRSQIVVRMLTWDPAEPTGDGLFQQRIERAAWLRNGRTTGRVVYAESDGAPGLIVDRYEDFFVLQASTLFVDQEKQHIADFLMREYGPRGVYDRSDVDGRDKEGLPATTGRLAGEEPPEWIAVTEPAGKGREVRLRVDVRHGHKTGTYLDQRENRSRIGARCAGAEVLNLFSYTGGFGVHAAICGAASVTNVDSSAAALALAEENAKDNGVASRVVQERADVFSAVRAYREQGRRFDVVVCDPPKFVHGAGQIERGTRAYKDVNRVALELVRPGGYFATFSCSGLVHLPLFQQVVFSAALEAKRDVQFVERLTQAEDHPVLFSFPEGEYLKGFLCRVGA